MLSQYKAVYYNEDVTKQRSNLLFSMSFDITENNYSYFETLLSAYDKVSIYAETNTNAPFYYLEFFQGIALEEVLYIINILKLHGDIIGDALIYECSNEASFTEFTGIAV